MLHYAIINNAFAKKFGYNFPAGHVKEIKNGFTAIAIKESDMAVWLRENDMNIVIQPLSDVDRMVPFIEFDTPKEGRRYKLGRVWFSKQTFMDEFLARGTHVN